METKMKKNKVVRPNMLDVYSMRGYTAYPGKLMVQPSQSQPGEAYSVQELLERASRGQAIPLGKQAVWDTVSSFDADDLDKLNRMDFGERAEFIEEVSVRVNEAKKVIEAQLIKVKLKKDQDKAEREAYQAKLKKLVEEFEKPKVSQS